MNEQLKPSLYELLTSRILGRPSFDGNQITEHSPMVRLMKEMTEAPWTVETVETTIEATDMIIQEDFYISPNMFGSTFYQIATAFEKAYDRSRGYQITTLPLSMHQIAYVLVNYFGDFNPRVILDSDCPRIALDKQMVDDTVAVNDFIGPLVARSEYFKGAQQMSCAPHGPNSVELLYKEEGEDRHFPASKFFKKGERLLLIATELFKHQASALFYNLGFYYTLKAYLHFILFLKEADTSRFVDEALKNKVRTSLKDLKLPNPGKTPLSRKEVSKVYMEYAGTCAGFYERLSLMGMLKKLKLCYGSEKSYQALLSRDQKIEKAKQLLDEKEYKAAYLIFNELTETLICENSREVSVYFERIAYTWIKMGDLEQAIKVLRKAEDTFSLALRAIYMEAYCHKRAQEYEKAIERFKELNCLTTILQFSPLYSPFEITAYSFNSLFYIGRCLSLLNQEEEALQTYLEAYRNRSFTKVDRIRPEGLLYILYLRIRLHEANNLNYQNYVVQSDGSGIQRSAFMLVHEQPEKLLPKTFKIFQVGINPDCFFNSLAVYFLNQNDPQRLLIFCDKVLKGNVRLHASTLTVLIKGFASLPSDFFKNTSHQKTGIEFCKIALEGKLLELSLCEQALGFLYQYAPRSQFIPILQRLLETQFELYQALPKPNVVEFYYEFAQAIASTQPKETLSCYQKAFELGFSGKNAAKKLILCAFKIIELSRLNQEKTVSRTTLQKMVQSALSNDYFCEKLLTYLSQENVSPAVDTLCNDLMWELAQELIKSKRPQKIKEGFILLTQLLDKHLYESFIERLSKGTLILPPSEDAYQLLSRLMRADPQYGLICSQIAFSLLGLSNIDPKLHENFIGCLFEKEYESALAYYVKVRLLLEPSAQIHQQFMDHFRVKPLLSKQEETIYLSNFQNEPMGLITCAKLLLSTQNPSEQVYSVFLVQLSQKDDSTLAFYLELLAAFQGKGHQHIKKEIILSIARILIETEIEAKNSQIVMLCLDALQYPFFHLSKQMINRLFTLLLPDLNPVFTLLARLKESNKTENTSLFMRESIQRSFNEYKQWLDRFPSDEEIRVALTHKLIEEKAAFALSILKPDLSSLTKTHYEALLNQMLRQFESIPQEEMSWCLDLVSMIFEKEALACLKESANDLLQKMCTTIDPYSSLYRQIMRKLDHIYLDLPEAFLSLFKQLTGPFGEEYVYLTGSRVLDLFMNKENTAYDWDFVVFCHADQARQILVEQLGFKKSKNLKVVNVYTKMVGSFPNASLLEVCCVEPIPGKTIKEQLRMNAEARDFTICAFFLNIIGEFFDFFNGTLDAEHGRLRSIQSAYQGFIKDPLRLLRAIKYHLKSYLWVEETEKAVIQSARLNQTFSPEIQNHLYHLLRKHLMRASPEEKERYMAILQTYNLWNKLFSKAQRMELREQLGLSVPLETEKKYRFKFSEESNTLQAEVIGIEEDFSLFYRSMGYNLSYEES